MIPYANEFIRQVLLHRIYEMLCECDEKQNAFFDQIFPRGIDKEEDLDKVKSAYDLVARTLNK